ncbi:hypothetical protein FA15DRAFT_672149 [Coprinopsis marcescibilis]|uniref:J domain-containing protein n=1 Tax=Coprinopsis marcescibilis TaxID=230819 RepID=A0A5C3KNE2_COPMA|nr:hypothetical protein FA15DRAFT_672149 [Coprinopsis marcescibilis]
MSFLASTSGGRFVDCVGHSLCPKTLFRTYGGLREVVPFSAGDAMRLPHDSRCAGRNAGLTIGGRRLRSPNQRVHSTNKRPYATVVGDSAKPTPPEVPYPYPTHPNPTAHQIFHLPGGSSQSQIKARYYELVRCHHPDSHHCRPLAPEVAHLRFQSIVASYDFLRGRTSSHLPGANQYGFNPGKSNFDEHLHELARKRRAQKAAEGETHWYDGFGDPRARKHDDYREDGIKERSLLALGVLALVLGLYPSFVLFPFQLEKTHKAAVVNLSQARQEAREFGDERRLEIRKRVQDMHKSTGIDGKPKDPDVPSP